MKKRGVLLTFIIIVMATAGWCNDQAAEKASAAALEGIANYYATMATLKPADPSFPDQTVYGDLCSYINQNRDDLIQTIAETESYRNLGQAFQMVESLYKAQAPEGYSATDMAASAASYFDSATGHRYYRTASGDYAEFTKKGKFFKTVPCNLPLLVNSRRVQPLTGQNYILYQKTVDGDTKFIALPCYETHPKGWEAQKALVSLR